MVVEKTKEFLRKQSGEHHPCGPSTLGRLMECPASLHLSAGEPDVESDEAKEGTLLHKSVRKLVGDNDPNWAEGLNEEQCDAVGRCHDFFDEVTDSDFRCGFPRFWMEKRVEISDARGDINWGTVDVIAITPQKIIVIDWKFGRKIKEDSLVLQVSNYAAAAVQDIPEIRKHSGLPIEAWVFFPRLHRKINRLRWRATTGEDAIPQVAASVRHVIDTAKAAKDTNARPGNWCDYCPHLPNCEAVRLAGETEIVSATSDDLVDPDRAILLYDLSLIVEKQAKAFRAMVRDLLLSHPDAIPGLQLRKHAGKRGVVDAGKLRERMIGVDKLSVVEWIRALAPTVVALEKAYVDKFYEGAGKGKITKGELKKRFAELAGDMVKKSESKVLTRV